MIDILIVEDQSAAIAGPYMLSHGLGFKTTLAFDGADGLVQLRRRPVDLVILDWWMPTTTGFEFLQAIENGFLGKRQRAPVKVVLYSGEPLIYSDFAGSSRFEIVDIWPKPFSVAIAAKRLKYLTRFMRVAA